MAGSSRAVIVSAPAAAVGPWWRKPIVLGASAVVLVGAVVAVWAGLGRTGPGETVVGETAVAMRGPLVVTIAESGEVESKRSVDIRCEVEGKSTIIWVIEEGTVVQKGDKLVELDAAELEETVRTQEMKYKTAKAAFEKAEKAYLIQQSTRESMLAAAALDVKFSLLDLQKYLGIDLANFVIQNEGRVTFADLVDRDDLGGEALQELRQMESAIDLAGEELQRAEDKVVWTRRLFERGYVTGSELKADELAAKRRQAELDQAKTSLDLFRRYTFPKQAEKAYRDWLEFKREYDRVDARTQSELDSAKATLDNNRDALALEEERLAKVRDQLAKTTITAPQAGMVVYDTGGGSRFRDAPPMEVGSTVFHQQTLIKLPDMSEMNVKVKLHESVVKQASVGAPAFITIDALPKQRLTGKVSKIAVMPDRQNWFLNPDIKTYTTEITLDHTPEGLKPGMSAQVEILVARRDDALQVPIAAVHVDKGFQVVYVKTPTGVDTRRVEVGLTNDQNVEVLKGLAQGEEVYLYKPANAPELVISDEERQSRRAFERAAPPRPEPTPPQAGQAEPAPAGVPDFRNMTAEQRQAMRQRLEQMPADQREAILQKIRAALPGAAHGLPGAPQASGDERPAGGPRGDRSGRSRRGNGAGRPGDGGGGPP